MCIIEIKIELFIFEFYFEFFLELISEFSTEFHMEVVLKLVSHQHLPFSCKQVREIGHLSHKLIKAQLQAICRVLVTSGSDGCKAMFTGY